MGLPRFFRDLIKFRIKSKNIKITISPILNDFHDQAGAADGHYFWQDLLCAQWINDENPTNHLDIGSRVDGFIAHLLSFRKVTLLDVRPLQLKIPNLEVLIGNAQEDIVKRVGMFDSVSSLHSVEHFGLGRYRDELEVNGHFNGINNISKCVKLGASFYLSFPIGVEEVQFNAQRILDPDKIIKSLPNFNVEKIVVIPWRGIPSAIDKLTEINLNKKGQAVLLKMRRMI